MEIDITGVVIKNSKTQAHFQMLSIYHMWLVLLGCMLLSVSLKHLPSSLPLGIHILSSFKYTMNAKNH
jgi:hypothetical protein